MKGIIKVRPWSCNKFRFILTGDGNKSNNAYDVASENVKTPGHFNRTMVYL